MEEDEVGGINVCCVIADSLRWDVFVEADPLNILQLGRARKAYSIGNSTSISMHGYLFNHPPIGVGRGFFVHGKPRKTRYETGVILEPSSIRKWMPKYFRQHGYFTMFMTPNPVLIRVDAELDGAYRRHFNHWAVDEYYGMPMGNATPQIIRDLNLQVKMNKEQPIFAVILLLDTHSPYHDGDGKTYLMDSSKPQLNREHQISAMKYLDNVFPNFVNIFSGTRRPTEFIFTSDHGENFGGALGTTEERGWGHNSFRADLQFGEELFAIPFVRGRIDDWGKSESKVHLIEG